MGHSQVVKALVFDTSMHGFDSRCPKRKPKPLPGPVTQRLEYTLDKCEVGSSNLLRPFLLHGKF